MKIYIYTYIFVFLTCFTFADDKNKMELVIEKDFIKALRSAVARKDKKSLDKIALKMEKYYCSSPGYEKGYIAIRKTSFLLEQGKYKEAVNFINVLLKKHKEDFNRVALNVAIILKGKALLELDKFNPALKVFKNVEKNYNADAKSVPEIYWINALYCMATCEEFLNDYSVALRYYKQLFNSYEKFYQQTPLNESYLYRSMGRCYRELKNYDKAYEYFQLGMNCAPDEYSKEMILGTLGMTYQKQKKFSKALESFDKTSELIGQNQLKRLKKIKILKSIGDGYFDLGKYKKAQKCYIDGISLEKNSSPNKMSVILFELYDMLGLTYLKLKQYQKSRLYFNILLEYSVKEYGSNSYYTASNYIIIAHSYYHEGEYHDAEKYFLKGIELLKKNKHKKSILVQVYINTALTYRKLRNRVKTLYYLKKALKILKKQPHINPQKIVVLESKIKKWSM